MSSYSDDTPVSVWVLSILGVIALCVLGGIGIRACWLADKATFEPAGMEQDRRNFEQSEAYHAGLRRDFDELRMAYAKAKDDDERSAILAVLRHRAEGAPPDAVPEDVKQFLKEKTR